MAVSDKILSLTKQLYPTGRAFKMPKSTLFEKLHVALALSESRAYQDGLSILNSILPDNNKFTSDDATDWERRLGLITNILVPLADRKAAIKRKINHPGSVRPRENRKFIQAQLQEAGFDVWVYENRFSDGHGGFVTKDPLDLGAETFNIQYGTIEYGERQYGEDVFLQIVANSLDELIDSQFDFGSNLRSTFFIGGQASGDFNGEVASVDINRKIEFRQLVLKLKPTQTAAILFINFT